MTVPVATSHKRTVPPQPALALASVAPSGLKETLLIELLIPAMSSDLRAPVATSHKRTVLSKLPFTLASVVPSGLNDILTTARPASSESSSDVSASYNHIPILPATASNEPSGEYVISFIRPLPRRALAPSGKLNWVCAAYCAKQGRMLRLETIKTVNVNVKRNVLFIFMDFCLLYGLSVVSTVFCENLSVISTSYSSQSRLLPRRRGLMQFKYLIR